MLALTRHAYEQCKSRGIDPYIVHEKVNSLRNKIAAHRREERVLVVIECLSCEIYLEDGSNGDQVVAAVDPRDVDTQRPAITTVFLNRRAQSYSTHYTILK